MGRRPPMSGLPEIGTIARKSATADLRWLATRPPQGDGHKSVRNAARVRLRAAEGPKDRRMAAQLFPTTLVGSYPQPEWLIDRAALARQTPPRVRLTELWRVEAQW